VGSIFLRAVNGAREHVEPSCIANPRNPPIA